MRKFPEAPRVVHISPAAFGDEGIFGGGERYPFELAKAMAAHTPVRLVTFGKNPRTWQDGPLSIRVLPLRGQWKGSEVNPLSLFGLNQSCLPSVTPPSGCTVSGASECLAALTASWPLSQR